MRRIPFIALAGALAVSLWFNWRNQASRLEATLGSFDPAANPAPLMPLKLEEIDFSGTGLSDEAWELPSPKTEEIIPSTLSEPRTERPPPPRPALGEWNPDVKLDVGAPPP